MNTVNRPRWARVVLVELHRSPHLAAAGAAISGADMTTGSGTKGFTTSIRTAGGRIMVHIDKAALIKLGAVDEIGSLLHTLDVHMPRFHALALQKAHREGRNHVAIGGSDVWWADERS
jgi:hypothetical protein